MTQYIDKDALLVEIENYKNSIGEDRDHCSLVVGRHTGQRMASEHFLSFIDTLEVKEVDLEHLEREVEDFCNEFDDRKDKWYDMTPHDKNIMTNPTWRNFAIQLAKHFFELGLEAAQNCNNSKCEDLRDDGICNFASTKLGRTMRCEKISCSRSKSQKGE